MIARPATVAPVNACHAIAVNRHGDADEGSTPST
jgi:hypothetical protein